MEYIVYITAHHKRMERIARIKEREMKKWLVIHVTTIATKEEIAQQEKRHKHDI
jgi:tRNA A37 threonylcarbamoyladenosine synthetase subunit TsaC/SUA5/YrdC